MEKLQTKIQRRGNTRETLWIARDIWTWRSLVCEGLDVHTLWEVLDINSGTRTVTGNDHNHGPELGRCDSPHRHDPPGGQCPQRGVAPLCGPSNITNFNFACPARCCWDWEAAWSPQPCSRPCVRSRCQTSAFLVGFPTPSSLLFAKKATTLPTTSAFPVPLTSFQDVETTRSETYSWVSLSFPRKQCQFPQQFRSDSFFLILWLALTLRCDRPSLPLARVHNKAKVHRRWCQRW